MMGNYHARLEVKVWVGLASLVRKIHECAASDTRLDHFFQWARFLQFSLVDTIELVKLLGTIIQRF